MRKLIILFILRIIRYLKSWLIWLEHKDTYLSIEIDVIKHTDAKNVLNNVKRLNLR
jgi:hypothetical protein